MGKLGIFYITVYTTQLSETSSAWYSIAVLGFKENPSTEKLLPEPDLNNQIIGIMTRFRDEKRAFMQNIETMYHQVLVPDDHQKFLRFIW